MGGRRGCGVRISLSREGFADARTPGLWFFCLGVIDE